MAQVPTDAPRFGPGPGSAEGPTHEEIEERAFARYQERGGADGADLQDWLEAELELTDGRAQEDEARDD
jgi:hypothetical protein